MSGKLIITTETLAKVSAITTTPSHAATLIKKLIYSKILAVFVAISETMRTE